MPSPLRPPDDAGVRFSAMAFALEDTQVAAAFDHAPALTAFVPTNRAFFDMPVERLQALKADQPAFARLLNHHVIAGRLSVDQLPGAHPTLAGPELTVKRDAAGLTVDGTAKVVCANVRTANATVYVIDAVLDVR